MAGRKEPQIPDAILDQLLSGTEASTACLQSKFLPLHRYTSRACGCADLMASPWMPSHTTRSIPEFAAAPLQGRVELGDRGDGPAVAAGAYSVSFFAPRPVTVRFEGRGWPGDARAALR